MEFEDYRLNAPVGPYVSPPETSVPTDLELTVAVVICTHSHPDLLRKCLEGVVRLRPAPHEVMVVDNTAGDKQTECVVREYAARYIVEPNLGLSRARNRGLAQSNSAIIAYLDDDAVPEERWLGFLLEPFADPEVAAVTGEIVFLESGLTRIEQEPPRSLTNLDLKWFETAAFGGLGTGSNMAIRKSACAGWGVFDERLGRGAPFGGSEESHAFLTLLTRGCRVIHIPAAIVFHPLKSIDIELEASRSIAYWLLLFFEFRGHRLELLQFLFRRLRHKPLSWHRSSPQLGPMITSGWRMRIRAGLAGILIYFRARKAKTK